MRPHLTIWKTVRVLACAVATLSVDLSARNAAAVPADPPLVFAALRATCSRLLEPCCSVGDPCDGGLACYGRQEGRPGICLIEEARLGEACHDWIGPCEAGSVCAHPPESGEGTCEACGEWGERCCGGPEACADDLACNPDGYCHLPRVGAGEVCNTWVQPCRDGLVCAATSADGTGRCAARLGLDLTISPAEGDRSPASDALDAPSVGDLCLSGAIDCRSRGMKGETDCPYGSPDCSRCVEDVVGEFYGLAAGPTANLHYHSKGGKLLPPHDARFHDFASHNSHIQGLVRIPGSPGENWFAFTRSNKAKPGKAGFALLELADIPGRNGERLNNTTDIGYFDDLDLASQATRTLTSGFFAPGTFSPSQRSVRFYHPIADTDHPGGIQVVGQMLAIANSCDDPAACEKKTFIEFHDVSRPGASDTLRNRVDLTISRGEEDAITHATSVGVVKLANGRYLMFVNAKDNLNKGWFYESTTTEIRPETEWTYVNTFHDDQAQAYSADFWESAGATIGAAIDGDPRLLVGYTGARGEYWGQYQNTTLVTECGSGDIYLVGAGNPGATRYSVPSESVPGLDVLHLFRVNWTGDGTPHGPGAWDLSRVGNREHDLSLDPGPGAYCEFRGGATVHVTPSGRMILYCSTRKANTQHFIVPDPELKMQEWAPRRTGARRPVRDTLEGL